jgi:hypothetical protein
VSLTAGSQLGPYEVLATLGAGGMGEVYRARDAWPNRPAAIALAAGLALALLSDPARAQVVVKVNDTVNFRLGLLLQTWADFSQDPISDGYSQNFFLRRVRLILAGNLAKDVSFFFLTDNPRLGNNPKALDTGLLIKDAFGEWRVFGNDLFILDAGKMLAPFTRNSLQAASSCLSLDPGTWTFLQDAGAGNGLQGDAGGDLGFQFKSYLADDHLEVRTGVFDGFRAPVNAGGASSRNPPRFVGRVVYNFFDTEKGYVSVGTNLGKKKILAIGGAYDTQGGFTSPATSTTPAGKGWEGYGGDFMIDWPIGSTEAVKGQDAVTAHIDYIHYDGGCRANAAGTVAANCLIPGLQRQEEVFTDLGFYFVAIKLQPFLRFEAREFKDTAQQTKNVRRYMGGLNYYIAQQNLKVTGAWERIVPNVLTPATALTKNTNHFVVQLQFYYF